MKKILSLLSVGATVSSLIATTPVVMAASKTTTKQNNKPAFNGSIIIKKTIPSHKRRKFELSYHDDFQ
jgi:hypothetical protein